ncbi:MAG: dienelactone hydrolase family protein [Saprospiraceae bacterium]|nr:dienelactone hydrolase family protein [Saprospiraceae bacterium]
MMELPNFSRSTFTHDNISHYVYTAGEGPPIIIIHELPGMTKECVLFAERLIKQGFKVYLPLLFGRPGQKAAPIRFLFKVCISREFHVFKHNKTSPIVTWLRALVRKADAATEAKGVGVIGMCLTGGFAIPLMVESAVKAPVLSQPSLPLGMSLSTKRALGVSPEDLEIAKQRVANGEQLLAFRFDKDPFCPPEKMQAYQEVFGEAFEYHELPSAQQPPGMGCHAVFTAHFVDKTGHPTKDALGRLIEFYREKLQPSEGV